MHTPIFSLEVFPPKRDAPIGTIYDTLDGVCLDCDLFWKGIFHADRSWGRCRGDCGV